MRLDRARGKLEGGPMIDVFRADWGGLWLVEAEGSARGSCGVNDEGEKSIASEVPILREEEKILPRSLIISAAWSS
jgi:hypothetical protein